MIILSHSGKQHSYQVAKAMYQLGILEHFYTSSYVNSSFLQKFLDTKPENLLSRRYIKGLPPGFVTANWWFELKEIAIRQIQGKSPAVQNAVYKRDEKFDSYISRKILNSSEYKNRENLYFWGFQGSCLESLKSARKEGMHAVCELSTAHVVAARRILGEEAILHPEWADSIDNLTFPANYEKRLIEEPHKAQTVIAASSFTQASLLETGISPEKIKILPLGCDTTSISFNEKAGENLSSRPLKLLYAGTVTQRKGIKYLLEALKNLGNKKEVELHIIGGIQGSGEALRNYKGCYSFHPAVSQQELFGQFSNYDALVLPTIFEGFGLVIVEAMAAGLPVITTPHSIGPELITEDENGYILPVRDIAAIEKAITTLREKSDEEFQEMRKKARKAAMEYSWDNYLLRLKDLWEKSLS